MEWIKKYKFKETKNVKDFLGIDKEYYDEEFSNRDLSKFKINNNLSEKEFFNKNNHLCINDPIGIKINFKLIEENKKEKRKKKLNKLNEYFK